MRRLTGFKFIECSQWFNGPSFLKQSKDNMLSCSIKIEVDDNDPEVKRDGSIELIKPDHEL